MSEIVRVTAKLGYIDGIKIETADPNKTRSSFNNYMYVLNATQKLKTSKAGGPSGVAPGVLKSCPLGWLVMLANFFTVLLSTGLYPAEWTMSKLVTL